MSDKEKLIELAKERFEDFGEADEILFAAVAAGKCADYTEGGDEDKIENADSWTDRRIIKASRIEWLCRDKQVKELVTDKGIQVIGAKIGGVVDLSSAEISFPLTFYECVFKEKIDLMHSTIMALGLDGSFIRSIKADGVRVERYVFLRNGFRAEGEICFLGAVIGGNLDCINGKFINKDGRAISADKIDVKGNVFLRDGFRAEGEVCFLGTVIGGAFECENGEFINEKGRAISADGMDINGNVFLRNGFKAEGEVRFLRATIGGDFDCKNGKFINEDDKAISADGIGVKGGVFLSDGFRVNGEVRFPRATIGGDFDCENGEFVNKDGIAIFADGMDIKGNVFLRNGFKAEGEACFVGAVIGGNFECEKSEFINKEGDAISAYGMDVKGSVFLRNGFKAEGKVSFVGAIVGGYFIWTDVNLTEKTKLDLRNAKAGVLWDEEKSWPEKGKLFLDGFSYENIRDDAPKDANSRIEWLNRQGKEQFRPGPYEQLAKVLNKIGHSEDAKKILIEKEKKITRLSCFGWRRFWRGVLGVTIGYGYRPWQALWFIVAIIFIGTMVFWSGYKAGVIVPVEKEAYASEEGGQLQEVDPKFNAFVYSIDMFVPLVDLRMEKYWCVCGGFTRGYMWFHIGFGWILTTLLVVGLTGLVRK